VRQQRCDKALRSLRIPARRHIAKPLFGRQDVQHFGMRQQMRRDEGAHSASRGRRVEAKTTSVHSAAQGSARAVAQRLDRPMPSARPLG